MTLTEKIRELCRNGYQVKFGPAKMHDPNSVDLRIRLFRYLANGVPQSIDVFLSDELIDHSSVLPEGLILWKLETMEKKLKAASQ